MLGLRYGYEISLEPIVAVEGYPMKNLKNLLCLSALLLFATATVHAQTDRAAPATRTDSSSNNSNNDEGREHHNYGWIGLLGLAGFAGLRRKNEEHEGHVRTARA